MQFEQNLSLGSITASNALLHRLHFFYFWLSSCSIQRVYRAIFRKKGVSRLCLRVLEQYSSPAVLVSNARLVGWINSSTDLPGWQLQTWVVSSRLREKMGKVMGTHMDRANRKKQTRGTRWWCWRLVTADPANPWLQVAVMHCIVQGPDAMISENDSWTARTINKCQETLG
jgi:hypothetical protein